jgi:hypothetical protein
MELSGSERLLRLSRLAALLSFLARTSLRTSAELVSAYARVAEDLCRQVPHKIEFSYLNPNLMARKIRSIILSLRTKGQTRSFTVGNDGFADNATPPSLPCT